MDYQGTPISQGDTKGAFDALSMSYPVIQKTSEGYTRRYPMGWTWNKCEMSISKNLGGVFIRTPILSHIIW